MYYWDCNKNCGWNTTYVDIQNLSLTNTLEIDDDGFLEVSDFTAEIFPVGSIITVVQDYLQSYDRYGILVGKAFCGDGMLNSELLDVNLANISTEFCTTSKFSKDHGRSNTVVR
ncbi:MAG: hypothetical protein QXN55_05070 [Candidatus Nitrosotenuis sp.]